MMEEIYETRTFYKKKMLEAEQEYQITKNPELQNFISRYNNIQMAKKIALNSAYGALVISILDISILDKQKVLHYLVNCLFDGLRKHSISILES